MTNVKISLPGGGICSILTIIFVISKITGYLTWSWWLVFAPIWGVICLVIGIPIIGFLGALIWFSYEDWQNKRRIRRRAKQRY